MAALTAEKIVDHKGNVRTVTVPCAVDIIYKGGLVKINAAGFAAPCAAEAGAKFIGVANETVDNSGGSAGDESVEISKEMDVILTGQATLAQTDVGQPFYASTDQDVSKTQASNEQEIGTLVEMITTTSGRFELKRISS